MKKIVSLGLIGVFLFGYLYYKNTALSDFDLHVVRDTTSSGGTRILTADLHFKDSLLLEGSGLYKGSPSVGAEVQYECIYEDGTWVVVGDSKEVNCEVFREIPISVSSFKQQVTAKSMLPAENCARFAFCYTIKK